MDIKVAASPPSAQALAQRKGHLESSRRWRRAGGPRDDVSSHAPQRSRFPSTRSRRHRAWRQDDPQHHRADGRQIDVEDDGRVNVASSDELVEEGRRHHHGLTATAELNKTYLGKVQRITDFGAFVEIIQDRRLLRVRSPGCGAGRARRTERGRPGPREGHQHRPVGQDQLSRKALLAAEDGRRRPRATPRAKSAGRRRRAPGAQGAPRPHEHRDRARGGRPGRRPGGSLAPCPRPDRLPGPLARQDREGLSHGNQVLARRAAAAGLLCAAALGAGSIGSGQEQGRREITVVAKRYAFSPARIEVAANDVLRITLVSEDIPHSFTIDEYRIAKRAAPGSPVAFEFRADRPGRFTYYCSLTNDDGCRDMRGELVVTSRLP